MAKRQYLDLAGLEIYDEQIKGYIDAADASTLTGLTSGSVTVKNAEHATSADSATNATNATNASNADKLGGQSPSYYAKATDIPTGALADKDSVSESDLDSALAAKVNAAAEGNHSHSNKSVLDGITSEKVAAWDSAEDNANAYTDGKIANLLDNSTEAVDSIMELAEAMADNADAIEALETIAAGKASSADLSAHTGNGDIHVTAAKKDTWDAAYTHSTSAHAPSNAQANVIESIKVNGTAQTISSKSVNITVPTNNNQLTNGAGYLVASDISGKADKTALDSVSAVANEAKSAAATNTQAILANTNAISGHTTRIAALEALDTHEAIPTASITALFA